MNRILRFGIVARITSIVRSPPISQKPYER